MIRVENDVPVRELDGKEVATVVGEPKPTLVVQSHWNWDQLVVLRLDEGTSFAVNARDLKAAIENATNVNRHG